MNKSEVHMSNELQSASVEMYHSSENTQSYETPVVHMNFFQVEASAD